MARISKVWITALLIVIQYLFTTLGYPYLQGILANLQGSSPEVAFQGFQILQMAYSYLWIVLLIVGLLIWREDIKKVLFPKIRL